MKHPAQVGDTFPDEKETGALSERNAFARWNALIHGLTVLMQGGMKYHEAAMQSGLMGYKSRGHGKNKPFTMSYFSNTSRRKGTTNKFHSGNVTSTREIARREKQNEDLFMKAMKAMSRHIVYQQENDLNG